MSAIKIKDNWRIILIGGGALVLLSAIVFAFGGSHINADQGVAKILEEEQTERDTLPEELAASIESLDLNTTRLLAEHSDQAYWAAYSYSGELCIVNMVGVGTDTWVVGIGCSSYEHFQRHGVGVTVIDELKGRHVVAIFIPDGYVNNARNILPEAYITNNVVVFDSIESVQSILENENQSVTISPDSDSVIEKLELIVP